MGIFRQMYESLIKGLEEKDVQPVADIAETKILKVSKKIEDENKKELKKAKMDVTDQGAIVGKFEIKEPKKVTNKDLKKMKLAESLFEDYIEEAEEPAEAKEEPEETTKGEKTAKVFLDYLISHDCDKTGPFGDKAVRIIKEPNYDSITLDSQASYIEFRFFSDGAIEVKGHYTDYDEDNKEYEANIDNHFSSYEQFADWYKNVSGLCFTDDFNENLPMVVEELKKSSLKEDALSDLINKAKEAKKASDHATGYTATDYYKSSEYGKDANEWKHVQSVANKNAELRKKLADKSGSYMGLDLDDDKIDKKIQQDASTSAYNKNDNYLLNATRAKAFKDVERPGDIKDAAKNIEKAGDFAAGAVRVAGGLAKAADTAIDSVDKIRNIFGIHGDMHIGKPKKQIDKDLTDKISEYDDEELKKMGLDPVKFKEMTKNLTNKPDNNNSDKK